MAVHGPYTLHRSGHDRFRQGYTKLTLRWTAGSFQLPGTMMASGQATDLREITFRIVNVNTGLVEVTLTLGGSGSQRLASAFERSPRLFNFGSPAVNEGGLPVVQWLVPGPDSDAARASGAQEGTTEPYTWRYLGTAPNQATLLDVMIGAISPSENPNESTFTGNFFHHQCTVEFGDGATALPVDSQPGDDVVTIPGGSSYEVTNASNGTNSFGQDTGSLIPAVGTDAATVWTEWAWRPVITGSNPTTQPWHRWTLGTTHNRGQMTANWKGSRRAITAVMLGGLYRLKVRGPGASATGNPLTWNTPADQLLATRHFTDLWRQTVDSLRRTLELELDSGRRHYTPFGTTAILGSPGTIAVPTARITAAQPRLAPPQFTSPPGTLAVPTLNVTVHLANPASITNGTGTLDIPAEAIAAGLAAEFNAIAPPGTITIPAAIIGAPTYTANPASSVGAPGYMFIPALLQPRLPKLAPPLFTSPPGMLTVPAAIDATGAPVVGATPILHALVTATFGTVLTLRSWTGSGSFTYDGASYSDATGVQAIDGIGSALAGAPATVRLAMPPGATRDAIRAFQGLPTVVVLVLVSLNNGTSWQRVYRRSGVLSAPVLGPEELTFQVTDGGNDLYRHRTRYWDNAAQQRASTGDLGLQYLAGIRTARFYWPEVLAARE